MNSLLLLHEIEEKERCATLLKWRQAVEIAKWLLYRNRNENTQTPKIS